MKNHLYSLLLAALMTACISDSTTDVQLSEDDLTDDTILVVRNLGGQNTEIDKFDIIGYGYDASAAFADLSAVRNPIFDLAKLDSLHPGSVIYDRRINSSSSGLGAISPTREYFLRNLGNRKDISQGSRPFKGTITSYFNYDDEEKDNYVYGEHILSFTRSYDTFIYFPEGLSPEFVLDIENKNPEQLIAKYGTHYIITAYYGQSFRVLYRAETTNPDREQAAKLGLTVAMNNVFGRFSGDIDNAEKKSAKGNFSQMVSYKATGGDTTKIKQIQREGMDFPQIDASDWLESISEDNKAFVDMRLHPIYDWIQDELKKEAVKNYIENYLK